ncbi:hypothetical protein ABZ726_00175 [Streptomyces hundungensis]|uniref:hypothetical protein n=1 Tax=Streptomyces hundungensis TaxID=1077946 RepID=UPI0033C8A84A
MSKPIPERRRLSLRRLTVALTCAGILAFSGLPGLTPYDADAAPRKGRCDQIWGIPEKAPAPNSFPGRLPGTQRPQADWDSYEFENPRRAMDGLTLPEDPLERKKFLNRIGTDSNKYEEGDPRRVFATYNSNITNGKRKWKGSFESWLNDKYIANDVVNHRGDAWEGKVVRDYQLGGPHWECQQSVEVTDKNGKKWSRTYDAINHVEKLIYEFKSTGALDPSQLPKDEAILSDPRYKDYKIVYIFAEAPDAKTSEALKALDRKLGGNRVSAYDHRSTAIPRYQPSIYSKFDTYMNAVAQQNQGSRGGANDLINGSAPDAATARQQGEQARQEDPQGESGHGPGGIDFTTLELRYVGTPVKGKGLDYAFSAKQVADPIGHPGYGGKEKAQLISDSYFTWMALTPEKFWVNLNPDEPDRVMDATFGKTDAGRVLLEADLSMKHDYAQTMNPKTPLGARFWDSLRRVDGIPCLQTVRNWIVPKPAKVREQDGGLYILDAPLQVKSVPANVHTTPGGGSQCRLSEADIKYNQELVDRMIVPEVEKKVNTAPEYADLRRVYASRVAAEWIKQQDLRHPSDYHRIIGSNDVARWPVRGAKWDKMDTYRRYVKSFKEGDYSFQRQYGDRVYAYTVGGVDFSRSPQQNVSQAQFKAQNPYLPRTTKIATKAALTDGNTRTLILGGNTNSRASAAKPSPSAGTSTKGGQEPLAKILADNSTPTGSRTPVGLITGTTAVLVGAGGGLTWWMLRRRSAP